MDFSPAGFFDLSETGHAAVFDGVARIWEALPRIADYTKKLIAEREAGGESLHLGSVHPRAEVGGEVFVAKGAVVEANAVIKGPAWIGCGSVVRSGAYLREHVLIGENCTLGNSSEFKNCLLFNECEVPHFNYVGDSVLGYRAHLGAGVVCSNVRLDRADIKLRLPDGECTNTGLRKFGAMIGDLTEIGCNAVLSPGSILGRRCLVYPLTNWSGILEENRIVKNRSPMQVVVRRS